MSLYRFCCKIKSLSQGTWRLLCPNETTPSSISHRAAPSSATQTSTFFTSLKPSLQPLRLDSVLHAITFKSSFSSISSLQLCWNSTQMPSWVFCTCNENIILTCAQKWNGMDWITAVCPFWLFVYRDWDISEGIRLQISIFKQYTNNLRLYWDIFLLVTLKWEAGLGSSNREDFLIFSII